LPSEIPKTLFSLARFLFWEIEIKRALGKLEAPDNLEEVLRECCFSTLPLTVEHALGIRRLPDLHHDPFDRMLMAQVISDGLTIVTRDSNILWYPVEHLPA